MEWYVTVTNITRNTPMKINTTIINGLTKLFQDNNQFLTITEPSLTVNPEFEIVGSQINYNIRIYASSVPARTVNVQYRLIPGFAFNKSSLIISEPSSTFLFTDTVLEIRFVSLSNSLTSISFTFTIEDPSVNLTASAIVTWRSVGSSCNGHALDYRSYSYMKNDSVGLNGTLYLFIKILK